MQIDPGMIFSLLGVLGGWTRRCLGVLYDTFLVPETLIEHLSYWLRHTPTALTPTWSSSWRVGALYCCIQ